MAGCSNNMTGIGQEIWSVVIQQVAASLSGGPTLSADNGRGLRPWLRSGRRTGSLVWMGWIMLLSDCQSGVVRGKQRK
jgi:hypothetical protein